MMHMHDMNISEEEQLCVQQFVGTLWADLLRQWVHATFEPSMHLRRGLHNAGEGCTMQYIRRDSSRDRVMQGARSLHGFTYFTHAICAHIICADTLNTVPAQLTALSAPALPELLSINLLNIHHSICHVMASFPSISLTRSILQLHQAWCCLG